MDSIFERYERLPLGNICDANGKRGSMDQGIRPVDPELRMAGWAYTVRCHPGDNLAIHKAIQEAPAGSMPAAIPKAVTSGRLCALPVCSGASGASSWTAAAGTPATSKIWVFPCFPGAFAPTAP